MKNKKVTSMFLSCALGFCVLFGYGSTSSAAETQHGSDKTDFLANDGQDVVIVRLGQIRVLHG